MGRRWFIFFGMCFLPQITLGAQAQVEQCEKTNGAPNGPNHKITHYFSGPAARKIEGTKHGLGNKGNPVLPCFSIACGKGKQWKYVEIPALKGLVCSGSTPIGSANDIMEGKIKNYAYQGKTHTISADVMNKLAAAKTAVTCNNESCVNKTGWFRCDDTGSAIQGNNIDMYVGNCLHGKGDNCLSATQTMGPFPKNEGGTIDDKDLAGLPAGSPASQLAVRTRKGYAKSCNGPTAASPHLTESSQ